MGGIDLNDSFSRLTNTGKYGDFKPGNDKGATDMFSTTFENLNPFGKTAEESLFGALNPLGVENQQAGEAARAGNWGDAFQTFNIDNPFGRGAMYSQRNDDSTLAQKRQAANESSAGGALATIATIFTGGSLLGGSGSGGAAGSGAASSAGTGASSGGMLGTGSAGSTGTAAGSSPGWMQWAQKGMNLMNSMGGQEQPQEDDFEMRERQRQQQAQQYYLGQIRGGY